jgi:hypothetical protein
MQVRPTSKKYRRRDWKRSRYYKRLEDVYGEDWGKEYSFYSYYPKKACRIQGNRAVRRYKTEIGNGCAYKKIYDVAWEVI